MLVTQLIVSFAVCQRSLAAVLKPSPVGEVSHLADRAAPSPPCTTTAIPSPYPYGVHCNEQGTLSKPTVPLSTSTVANANACRDACLNLKQCISFGFQKSNRKCTLYSTTLNDQGFTSKQSGVAFWNRRCFDVNCLKCQAPQTFCSGNSCTNTNTDTNNCGACGNKCSASQTCSSGVCTTPPPTCSGSTPNVCGTSCVNFNSDSNNCGGCGTTCATGFSCSGGSCSHFPFQLQVNSTSQSHSTNDVMGKYISGSDPRSGQYGLRQLDINTYYNDPTRNFTVDPSTGNLLTSPSYVIVMNPDPNSLQYGQCGRLYADFLSGSYYNYPPITCSFPTGPSSFACSYTDNTGNVFRNLRFINELSDDPESYMLFLCTDSDPYPFYEPDVVFNLVNIS